MLLELYGSEVRVAHTGPDGVRAAVEMEPDLVLCGIGLPGLDGYGVARRLRGRPWRRPVLVALTWLRHHGADVIPIVGCRKPPGRSS